MNVTGRSFSGLRMGAPKAPVSCTRTINLKPTTHHPARVAAPATGPHNVFVASVPVIVQLQIMFCCGSSLKIDVLTEQPFLASPTTLRRQ